MGSFLLTCVSGNENFGGYLSIDGEKPFLIKDDITYEISSGRHNFTVYSTSNFQRSAGRVQAFLYNNTGSSGRILDNLEANTIRNELGDCWEIDIVLEDDELFELSMLSRGQNIVGAPMYTVHDLGEERAEELRDKFRQMEAEREAAREKLRNTPRRSVGKIVAGSILTGISGIFGLNIISMALSGEMGGDPIVSNIILMVIVGLLAILGITLFLTGMKKKIRK